MKKRVVVLLCICQLAALLCAAPAAAASILRDGTFETLEVDGDLLSYWTGAGTRVQDDVVCTGSRALQLTPSASAASLQQFTGPGAPVVGKTYIIRFSFWRESAETKLTLYHGFVDAENATIAGTGLSEEILTEEVETWSEAERRVTVPEGASRLHLKITVTGALCYVDDIICITIEEDVTDDTPYPVYGDTGENPLGMLRCNMDFESVADTSGSNMWTNITEWRTNTVAHGDSAWSYHVESSGDMISYTTITRNKLVGGATYQITLWLNVVSANGTIQLKPEFYKDMTSQSSWAENGSAYTSEYSRNLEPMGDLTYGKWRRVVRTFVAPPDAAALRLAIRTFGGAEFYVDDISITQISAPFYGKLTTDAGVYYTDMQEGEGKASLWVNTISYPALAAATVDFCLKAPDGSVAFWANDVSQNADGTAEFAFPLSELAQLKTAYTIEAAIQADGAGVETAEIYVYERPAMLDAEGNCYVDGKPFQPLVAYHVKAEDYKKAAAAGFNVVQSYASGGHGAALEAAAEAEIRVLLVLYNGMKPAGHPDNIESTVKAVKDYKDHPALFGYAIMDEPTVYSQDPSAHLMASYKAIRDLDDVHPVWIVEGSAASNESSTELCSKYCDIFAIDHYVPDANNHLDTYSMKRHTEKAKAALAPGRPLYVLADGGGVNSGNAPESIRNQGWQAFLGGADAIGYYMLGNNVNVNGLLDAVGEFVDTDYQVACGIAEKSFSAQTDGEVYYRHWVENGKTYTLALNRIGYTVEADGQSAVPPARVQIPGEGFTVTCTAALEPLEVRLWEGAPADLFASGEVTVTPAGTLEADRRIFAALYTVGDESRELVRFACGEAGSAESVYLPEESTGAALLLRVMVWRKGITPSGQTFCLRTREG